MDESEKLSEDKLSKEIKELHQKLLGNLETVA